MADTLTIDEVERPRRARIIPGILASLALSAPFYLLIIIYLAAYFVLGKMTGADFVLHPLDTFRGIATLILPLTLFAVAVLRIYHIAVVVRPAHPLPAFLCDFTAFVSSPKRLINALPMLLVVTLFMQCFSSIKDIIPLVRPFSWDTTFAALDRTLHFGADPWRILQPVFGHWWASLGLNFVYNLWFFIIWFALIAMIFSEKADRLRMRFLLSFFLCWSIGGSFLAIVFSSAGPVYFERLGFGADYAPLMAYLRNADSISHLWALDIQEMLWTAYIDGTSSVASGITAMPSMHVTSAVLIALLCREMSRPARIAGYLFAASIMIGSVHLGWHYAVDGYAGAALAVFFWWLSGRFADWHLSRPFARKAQADLDALKWRESDVAPESAAAE